MQVWSAEPVKPSHAFAPRAVPALLPSPEPPYAPAANDVAEKLNDAAAAAISSCCFFVMGTPSSMKITRGFARAK
jgi:hypothetical protein